MRLHNRCYKIYLTVATENPKGCGFQSYEEDLNKNS
jgi:hypothetical protein